MSDNENGDMPEGMPPIGSQTLVIKIEAGPNGLSYKSNGVPQQVLSVLYHVQLEVMHDLFQQKTMEKVLKAQAASGMPLVPQ